MSCFFQAEDGIRDLVRSRGLGDVYKRQIYPTIIAAAFTAPHKLPTVIPVPIALPSDTGISLSLIHI